MNSKYLTIKQAATLLGVTPLTLRNWDRKGFLAAYRHPANNYRLYRYEDVEAILLELKQSRPARAAAAPIFKIPVRFDDDTPKMSDDGEELA